MSQLKGYALLILLACTNLLLAQETESIEVDCKQTKGEFRHLHGFLHGEINLEKDPYAIQTVQNANFKFWRNANRFGNQILADSLNFNTCLVISDLYADKVGGYTNAQPWLDWPAFQKFVDTLMSQTITDNIAPTYWDVWNESQSKQYWAGNLNQLLDCYQIVRNTADSIDPNIKLTGPSIVKYNQNFLKVFLDSLANRSITLDAVSWHEFGIPDSASLHVEKFRKLMSANPQWGKPEIHINEYSPRQTNQIPAWKVGWFYHLEKSEVDWANNACWDDMNNGTTVWNNCDRGLNGILYHDEATPLPVYWVHYAYGQMSGQKVFSTGTDSKSLALASVEENQIKLLVGRYYSVKTGEFIFSQDAKKSIADLSVKVFNLPFSKKSEKFLRIQKIPNENIQSIHLPLYAPIVEVNNESISGNDTIAINLSNYHDGDAYYITISATQVTSVSNDHNQGELSIYPNPNKGVFTLYTSDLPLSYSKVVIADLFGNVVYERSHNSHPDPEPLNVEINVPSGIYFVRLESKKGMVIKKIMVEQ